MRRDRHLGGIESARATELDLALWLQPLGTFGTPQVSVHVVRVGGG